MADWVLAEDIGLETLGGVFTKVLSKGTQIPCEASQVFSTAEDNQAAVTLRLAQGSEEAASQNRPLGEFNLEGIPPAPRGVPMINVTFGVDAEGNLNVTATDQGSQQVRDLRVAASADKRVKLQEAAAARRLESPLCIVGPDGARSDFLPAGEVLPAARRIEVRTTEAAQTMFAMTLFEGADRKLGNFSFRMKGNESDAGALLRTAIECVVTRDGEVQLRNVSNNAIVYTANEKMHVTGSAAPKTGIPGGQDLFKDVFGDVFGKGFGGEAKAQDGAPAPGAAPQPAPDDVEAGRIFISHAATDAHFANTVVAQIEGGAAQHCWIAPRNVRPGFDYRLEILENIKNCAHCVVLMSESANASPHVLREISLADQYSKRIVMVKIDDVSLRPELEYLLHGRHWVTWEDIQAGRASLV